MYEGFTGTMMTQTDVLARVAEDSRMQRMLNGSGRISERHSVAGFITSLFHTRPVRRGGTI